MISFYKEFGELGYLANYSSHGFYKDGIYYKTVEHYYQAAKYDDENIRNKIINADTPKEASNIGRDRNNKRINNFKNIKIDVMYDGILEKFRQNRDIAYKLIETRNDSIEEATINEYYWGVGKDRTGQNNIGKILIKVRDEIKKEIISSIISNCQGKDVYVLGHEKPDADSLFSSFLLYKILRGMGIEAHFAILSENYEYCENDKKIISDYLPIEPEIIDVINDKKFILVDHNNLESLNVENVIGAIDHHLITGEVYDTLEIEYASTGLLLYDLFKDEYEFSYDEKLLVYLTVLTDTEYLVTSRYTLDDRKLVAKLGIDIDVKELQRKYFTVTDFGLSIEQNMKSNYKKYYYNDKEIERTLIYSYNKEYDEYFEKYTKYVIGNKLLIWCNYENMKTSVYYLNHLINYDYILTSTNLILKDLSKCGLL